MAGVFDGDGVGFLSGTGSDRGFLTFRLFPGIFCRLFPRFVCPSGGLAWVGVHVALPRQPLHSSVASGFEGLMGLPSASCSFLFASWAAFTRAITSGAFVGGGVSCAGWPLGIGGGLGLAWASPPPYIWCIGYGVGMGFIP